jgi:hypothetical protein
MKQNIRFVVVKGNTYLRAEDVAEYIVECGSSEETDVRNRLKEAARNIVESSLHP